MNMLKLTKLRLLISIAVFCTLPLFTQAQSTKAQDLIDSWRQLAETEEPASADKIYDQSLQEGSAIMQTDPETAARLFMVGAELCRDLNHPDYPMTLFKLAVDADPDNAHLRRVYADYLIGYRGLNEKAWEQYGKAQQLLKNDSSPNVRKMKKSLDRSIQIFRRDAGDGAVIFENEDFSLSFKGGFRYASTSKDQINLASEYFRVQRRSSLTEDGIISQWSRNIDDRYIYDAAVKLRAANPDLPTLEFYYNLVDFDESAQAADNPRDILDWTFETFGMNLQKTFAIDDDLVLVTDLSGFNRTNEQTYARNGILYNEEDSWTVDLNTRTTFHRESASFTINAGGSFSTIDPNYISDDSQNTQRLSLRNSIYYGAEKEVRGNLARYQGRRSSHQEIGFLRRERLYKSPSQPITEGDDWLFYVTAEELGLLEGRLDLYTTLRFRESSTSAPTYESNSSVFDILVRPVWVPIYKLYDNDFTSGWEYASVALPLEFGMGDSPYNRATASIEVGGRYVIFGSYAVEPSIGVECAYYTEIEQTDLGGFVQISIK